MQWNNYLCASPPQFKDLNQSNSAFKRLVADSPMSTNKKLNLNTGSQKKKKYDLTSNKKIDL